MILYIIYKHQILVLKSRGYFLLVLKSYEIFYLTINNALKIGKIIKGFCLRGT